MAHDAGMERGASSAAFVTPQGRVLSLDPPRRTQLPCWLAAVALHGVAIAIVAFHDPMPATVPAPVPIEIVMLDSPNDASLPAVADPPDPAAEAEPPPPNSSTPPTPPEAAMIEPPPPEPVVEDRPEPESPVAVEAPPLPAPTPPPPSPRPRRVSPAPLTAEAPPPREAPSAAAPDAVAPRLAESPPLAVEMVVPPAPPRHRAESDYVRTLLGWLERYKEYPRAARMRRIEGQVVLELSIMADGQIASVKVLTSSGHPTLDDAALEMVRRAAPVPRPQGGLIHLLVPVVFALGAR